jgi:hypothetical protein
VAKLKHADDTSHLKQQKRRLPFAKKASIQEDGKRGDDSSVEEEQTVDQNPEIAVKITEVTTNNNLSLLARAASDSSPCSSTLTTDGGGGYATQEEERKPAASTSNVPGAHEDDDSASFPAGGDGQPSYFEMDGGCNNFADAAAAAAAAALVSSPTDSAMRENAAKRSPFGTNLSPIARGASTPGNDGRSPQSMRGVFSPYQSYGSYLDANPDVESGCEMDNRACAYFVRKNGKQAFLKYLLDKESEIETAAETQSRLRKPLRRYEDLKIEMENEPMHIECLVCRDLVELSSAIPEIPTGDRFTCSWTSNPTVTKALRNHAKQHVQEPMFQVLPKQDLAAGAKHRVASRVLSSQKIVSKALRYACEQHLISYLAIAGFHFNNDDAQLDFWTVKTLVLQVIGYSMAQVMHRNDLVNGKDQEYPDCPDPKPEGDKEVAQWRTNCRDYLKKQAHTYLTLLFMKISQATKPGPKWESEADLRKVNAMFVFFYSYQHGKKMPFLFRDEDLPNANYP